MEKDLKCPKCKNVYRDPKVLPCGESMCQACIDELKQDAQSNKVKCSSCLNEHLIPNSGSFLCNKYIAKKLSKKSRASKSTPPSPPPPLSSSLLSPMSTSVETCKAVLKSIETKMANLKMSNECPKDFVAMQCYEVRNQIDIAVETLIMRLNEERERMFDELTSYEEECKKKCELFERIDDAANEAAFVDEVDKFETNTSRFLQQHQQQYQQQDVIELLQDEKLAQLIRSGKHYLSRIDEKMFNTFGMAVMKSRMPKFVSDEEPKFAFGDLVFESVNIEVMRNLKTKKLQSQIYYNMNNLKSYDIGKYNVRKDETTVTQIGADQFAVCYYNRSAHLCVDILDRPSSIKSHLFKTRDMCARHSACANYDYLFLFVLGSSPETARIYAFTKQFVDECEVASPHILALVANNLALFALSPTTIYRYAFDLRLVNRFATSPSWHMPFYAAKWSVRTTFRVDDDELLYFHTGDEMAIVDLSNGDLLFVLDSTRISSNFIVVSESIVCLDPDPAEKRILFFRNDGDFVCSEKRGLNEISPQDWKNISLVDIRNNCEKLVLFDFHRQIILLTS